MSNWLFIVIYLSIGTVLGITLSMIDEIVKEVQSRGRHTPRNLKKGHVSRHREGGERADPDGSDV